MQNLINKKVLITTSSWFFGKDGKQYKAIHGTLKGVHEAGKTLGFIPNRAHANWYFEIGEMIIMGCQVMYVLETEIVNTGDIDEWVNHDEHGYKIVNKPTSIYVVN